MVWKRSIAAVILVGAVLLGIHTPSASNEPPSDRSTPVLNAPRETGIPPVPLADPNSLAVPNTSQTYITYATTVGGYDPCGGTAINWWYVPYVRRAGISLTDECVDGDAMPGGVGAWATGAVWAPGVGYLGNGKWRMYYTATKAGTEQKCIGRATASNSYGPFVDTSAAPVICPGGGRWALDAQVLSDGGKFYLAYRDDSLTVLPHTGLSVVQLDSNGWPIMSTRRGLLLSTHVAWGQIANGENVIENPSLFRSANGNIYLFFSGNNWNSTQYAVGIASCGSSILSGGYCSTIAVPGSGFSSYANPYFGYSLRFGNDPQRELPRDKPGPGGMDVFTTHGGNKWVDWHYWVNTGEWVGPRYLLNGPLTQPTTNNFFVD